MLVSIQRVVTRKTPTPHTEFHHEFRKIRCSKKKADSLIQKYRKSGATISRSKNEVRISYEVALFQNKHISEVKNA